jgi:NAD(P)H-quinone oxidoreductase subunit 4
LIFRGSFERFPIQTLLCMIGTGLTAVYFLLLVNKTFFGRLPEAFSNLPEVRWSERAPGFVLAVVIVVFGLQPNWMARWSESLSVDAVKAIDAVRVLTDKPLAKVPTGLPKV